MRLNLSPILYLAGILVACGGSSDTMGFDGGSGGAGGGGGAPPVDSGSGDQNTFDSGSGTDSGPGTDSASGTDSSGTDGSGVDGGSCSDKCTSDTFCQTACGPVAGGEYCCDVATGVCYPSSAAMCPTS